MSRQSREVGGRGSLDALVARLARRDGRGAEANVQADVRQMLLAAPFSPEPEDVAVPVLEVPVGEGQRIDVEVGATVIEVKRDLRKRRVREEAREQFSVAKRVRDPLSAASDCSAAGTVGEGEKADHKERSGFLNEHQAK